MSDAPGDGWPKFNIVRLSSGSDWDGAPVELQVPEALIAFSYRAAESLTAMDGPTPRRFFKFGSTGLFGSLLFDSKTGSVVQHQEGARGVSLVSTSIAAFNEIVKKVIETFPFYSTSEDGDEMEVAAAKVKEIVCSEDPEAYFAGGFWETFVSDIEMGDYSTEEVIG
ncbi:SUKH-4 family immunity protein [Streptomyces sp. NPDC006197]|uniref:SUKH-4 family immunity protein n=1 Tax=Streptomyces sp. NPDC006197 TaxID=3156685 RepID=UPI0033B4C5C4